MPSVGQSPKNGTDQSAAPSSDAAHINQGRDPAHMLKKTSMFTYHIPVVPVLGLFLVDLDLP